MANEIELMVSIRRQGENGLQRRGDVMTCRLAGGKWGSEELKTHQVVTWPGEDPTEVEEESAILLQAILHKKSSWGEPNPRVDYPFCEIVNEYIEDENGDKITDFDNKPLQNVSMTNRSVLHFDFTPLPQEQLDAVWDKNVAADFVSADEVTVSIDQRGVDKRNHSERGLKAHRDILEENPVLHAETALRRDQTTNIEEYISQDKKPIDSWSI